MAIWTQFIFGETYLYREERDQNRRLREEQDAAYQAALQTDQERVRHLFMIPSYDSLIFAIKERKRDEQLERERQKQEEVEHKQKAHTQKLQVKAVVYRNNIYAPS